MRGPLQELEAIVMTCWDGALKTLPAVTCRRRSFGFRIRARGHDNEAGEFASSGMPDRLPCYRAAGTRT